MRKNNLPAPVDASKMCPLEMFYDADVHEAVANLRILDGDIPVHPQYGMPVNFFLPKNRASSGPSHLLRNWGTSVRTFALFQLWSLFSLLTYINRFFLFLVLDKAVCPFLVKHFEMGLWHPTDEVSLDALMNDEIDM